MSIRDDVRGKIPEESAAAMTAGLASMGSSDVDVIVTEDFVKAVQDITGTVITTTTAMAEGSRRGPSPHRTVGRSWWRTGMCFLT